MPVLTADDRAFFDEQGYVVVHDAVPPENLEACIQAIWDFLGIDRHNPDDWYRPPLPRGGMVEMYQHQAMWDNRQHPRIHEAFADLWGTEKLWVSIDRVNLKPPRHPDHPEYDYKGFIHVDNDLANLHSRYRGARLEPRAPFFWVQGVLYLTDTTPDQGGFQCVPGMHRELKEWVVGAPPDAPLPDLRPDQAIPIPGRAGDLVIWDNMLPHGNGHNVSDRPRLAQFISMYPARETSEESRQHRIRCWQEREPPGPPTFPGDPRRIEQQFGTTAVLTPLGRRLLGLAPWDEKS
jgi:ectoine hydroxylase-related dioxygenase (phytanoyl-CoA dioxygenase family)